MLAPLQARFRDALDERGLEEDPESLRFAIDLARLLVRSTADEVGAVERRTLSAALAARTTLSAEARDVLLGLALDPRHRAGLKLRELRAYGYRFGSEALGVLRGEQEDELDLPGFAQRYGPEESLLLLDGLFRVAAANGEVSDREARALEEAARELGVDGVLLSALFQRYDPRHAAGDLSFRMSGDRVTVGRSPSSDVVLSDPQVARHHCTFLRTGDGGWRVMDAGSGRPVLLDGVPVASAPVRPSSQIRIGPWTLQVIDRVLKAYGHRKFTALSARNLSRHIDGVSLLDDVSFTLFSGEVVALVGPSGAGKTTLINAISGVAPADSGEVLLDGRDFHQILAADASAVGLVPQDDLVHPELTVEESLFYSGRLRFSGDVSDAEVRGEVDRVLTELNIQHIRHSRIGDAVKRGISGGQRKRVNLGSELLTRSTRVLFLDEPTSGLDPRSAHGIVSQVRQLADDGKIVFLVTHDLSPGILEQVDHLMVMAPGGRLAYFGPPEAASRYFGVSSSDRLFDKLEERRPEDWGAAYKKSRDFRTFVATREFLLRDRAEREAPGRSGGRRGSSAPLQLATQVRRYARTKLRDRDGLGVLALQPVVLALVIYLVFPVPTARLIFMLSLSCMWFGMSAAVRELIADRTIWRRERKVGVGVTAYLMSKVLVLGALVAAQCSLLNAIVYAVMGMGGDYGYSLLSLCGVGALTGFTGASLGLLVSSAYSSSEAAVGTLPLLLIPQICFSSVMVSLRNMSPRALAVTWINPERYAYDLMLKVGETFGKPPRYSGGDYGTEPLSGTLYDLGLKPSDAENFGLSPAQLIGALAAFSGVFLAGAWLLTWRRDRV